MSKNSSAEKNHGNESSVTYGIARMRGRVEKMFNSIFEGEEADSETRSNEGTFSPLFHTEDTDEYFIISFDVPGLHPEDLKVGLSGQCITVTAQRNLESYSSTQDGLSRREDSRSLFKRTYELPFEVKAEDVQAQYDSGVLRVAVPKDEAQKPFNIPIQVGPSRFWTDLVGH